MQPRPYFSIVVTARNDNHGGNLLGRMQAFVNGWMAQAKRHQLRCELIIVEWNPPAERPRLAQALRWPADAEACSVRIIEVSGELHRRYAHAEALPLYQMIAKNVGIRRAHGRFVLATNIDILFSDDLVGFLAAEKLEPWRMYRIDRHDAMTDVPVDGIDAQLEYCRSHLIRVNAREGTLPVTPDGRRTLSPNDIARAESGMTFGRGWFPPEQASAREFYRWADNDAEIHFPPPFAETRSFELDLEPGPGAGELPLRMQFADQTGNAFARIAIDRRCVLKVVLPAGAELLQCSVENGGKGISGEPRTLNLRVFRCEWIGPGATARGAKPSVTISRRRSRVFIFWRRVQQLIALLAGNDEVHVPVRVGPRLKRWLRAYVRNNGIEPEPAPAPAEPLSPVFLHTNGCGDFTLMAREHWFDLRGYPEFDLFSMNLDCVFCYAAHHAGVVEEMLREPMRIYHIEHGSGSGWTPEGQARLFARIAQTGLSFLDHREVFSWATEMRRLRAPMIFNLENWGLAEFELPETVIERSSYGMVQAPR